MCIRDSYRSMYVISADCYIAHDHIRLSTSSTVRCTAYGIWKRSNGTENDCTVDFRCVEKYRTAFHAYVMIFIARSKFKHTHFHDTQHRISQRGRISAALRNSVGTDLKSLTIQFLVDSISDDFPINACWRNVRFRQYSVGTDFLLR